MQQRRLRPGDVLDDYCPRERRITDHAIVAMIEDNIKQTRCVSCDAEHEYKQAKVPPQRRKKAPALFTQVLDGLQAPARPPHLPDVPDDDPDVATEETAVAAVEDAPVPAVAAIAPVTVVAAAPIPASSNGDADRVLVANGAAPLTAPPGPADGRPQEETFESPVRRQLIRAALPRPEGQPPPARVMPEFTIRQPNMNGRASRPSHGGGGGGGRRRGQHQAQGQNGPMRFGRGAHGQRSNGNGQGRPGGHAGANANRSRRGGKKGR